MLLVKKELYPRFKYEVSIVYKWLANFKNTTLEYDYGGYRCRLPPLYYKYDMYVYKVNGC